ncbi:MAG: D-alanyl-D-alanine carboxypeptidase [Chthoniobacter sp.]|nr:D-alanyl-D-alanine carboxypeptidase [Chthoniobacter sp.]
MKRLTLLSLALSLLLGGLPAAAATKKTKRTTPAPAAAIVKTPLAPAATFPLDPVFDGVPEVKAGSAIVVDAESGQILHAINADERRPVASTQKLLTALIIAEEGGLDERIRVEQSDTFAEPSKLYIKAGEVYSRRSFLNILLVHSMNDVARALARDNAGSIERFADKMNARATQLGMRNSHFINPNGLPAPGQFSTARDMAKVAMLAYRNRTLREMVCQKAMLWRYNDGRTRVFETTNKVLKAYPFCNGMKTGYTEAAGRCLISSASRGGRHIIVVALGDDRNITTDSYRLLAWGLST